MVHLSRTVLGEDVVDHGSQVGGHDLGLQPHLLHAGGDGGTDLVSAGEESARHPQLELRPPVRDTGFSQQGLGGLNVLRVGRFTLLVVERPGGQETGCHGTRTLDQALHQAFAVDRPHDCLAELRIFVPEWESTGPHPQVHALDAGDRAQHQRLAAGDDLQVLRRDSIDHVRLARHQRGEAGVRVLDELPDERLDLGRALPVVHVRFHHLAGHFVLDEAERTGSIRLRFDRLRVVGQVIRRHDDRRAKLAK